MKILALIILFCPTICLGQLNLKEDDTYSGYIIRIKEGALENENQITEDFEKYSYYFVDTLKLDIDTLIAEMAFCKESFNKNQFVKLLQINGAIPIGGCESTSNYSNYSGCLADSTGKINNRPYYIPKLFDESYEIFRDFHLNTEHYIYSYGVVKTKFNAYLCKGTNICSSPNNFNNSTILIYKESFMKTPLNENLINNFVRSLKFYLLYYKYH